MHLQVLEKTIVGLKIIAEKKQPALIITHRKQIADQWIERIEAFLGIPKNEVGKIGQGKTKIGKQITVAMIQSLSKELEKPDGEKLLNAFAKAYYKFSLYLFSKIIFVLFPEDQGNLV